MGNADSEFQKVGVQRGDNISKGVFRAVLEAAAV